MESPKSILEALEPFIIRERGALFEGDVMHSLLRDWYVVRSFEFAAVDGALVISSNRPNPSFTTSYAARYMYYLHLLSADPESVKFVTFDVKSSASRLGSHQLYHKTVGQHSEVAFFIGICAADPSYVELIPNKPEAIPPEVDRQSRELVVNQAHKTFLDGDPAVYGALNPCGSPYRMPLGYLNEAVARVRRCAKTGETYVNPWTKVPFVGWRPMSTGSMETLAPAASGAHYTGYLGIVRLWRHLHNARTLRDVPIDLEFVGLQPRLADFKLVLDGGPRQALVQYKIDNVERAWGNFANVAIVRDGTPFFSSFDRFDFLLYEFSCLKRLPSPAFERAFFLIPERLLPTNFYTVDGKDMEGGRVDLSLLGLHDYFVEMDDAGLWVRQAVSILRRERQPRRVELCPFRTSELVKPVAASSQARLKALIERTKITIPAAQRSTFQHERGVFRRTLFTALLAHCSQRLTCLVVLLADDHPDGDFAFCAYQWSAADRAKYTASGRPPKVLHELPASTPVITVYAFVRTVPCTVRGPTLSAAEFRRIDSSSRPRLVVFDPMGPEGRTTLGTLFVVPTEDLSVDLEQQRRYERSLGRNHHKGEFAEKLPLLASMLHSGYAITDYTLSGGGGPSAFDGSDWIQLWQLLHNLTGTGNFEYPSGRIRQPSQYRCSVRHLNMRLLAEIARPPTHGTPGAAGGPNVGPEM